MAKDKEYQTLIHTTRWLSLRRDTLTAHPCCQRCASAGLITAATEVHHINPVEEAYTRAERMRRMYDRHNLMALCHSCHVQIHTELGRSGKQANITRTGKQVKDIIKRFF